MEYLYKVCEISVKYHTNEEFDKKLFVKTKEDAVKILRGFMQEDIELEEMTYGVIFVSQFCFFSKGVFKKMLPYTFFVCYE